MSIRPFVAEMPLTVVNFNAISKNNRRNRKKLSVVQ